MQNYDRRNKPKKTPAIGWCSWYAFGHSINQDNIVSQAKWFKEHSEIPIEYILIDEGWTSWGDWEKHNIAKFPNGMKNLADSIKKLGLKPGIWIAPFLIERKSDLFEKHPDWFVKKNGKLVNGANWTPFDKFYLERFILNIKKDEVRRYIFKCVDELLDKNRFDLVKLDFLYSIYFIPGVTPNEAGGFIRQLLNYISKKYPYVYTIACGSPLLPVIGATDSLRIGPDTISPYLDGVPLISNLFHELRVDRVISNINRRSWTKDFWNIDPDVFVCRKSLGISDKKLLKLQIAFKNLKGNLFLGDDMTKLDEKRIKKFILPLFRSAS